MEGIFLKDRSGIWKELNKEGRANIIEDIKFRDKIYEHFKDLSKPVDQQFFDAEHQKNIEQFLRDYDAGGSQSISREKDELIKDLLNNYFDIGEVKHVINRLKGGKRPKYLKLL